MYEAGGPCEPEQGLAVPGLWTFSIRRDKLPMRIRRLHDWNLAPKEARLVQQDLRRRVRTTGGLTRVRWVAGADVAFAHRRSDRMYAGVVVLSFPDLKIVEQVVVEGPVTFPYVPGLLSFREAPVLLRAFAMIGQEPDVIFIDGHGLAHPRRFGLACHIGLLLGKPVIGCAKSLLIGTYREPAQSRSSESSLTDSEDNVIGAVVRSRARVKPIFVSVGHRISLKAAVRLTLACTKGFRIPEPTRQADLLAERAKRGVDGA